MTTSPRPAKGWIAFALAHPAHLVALGLGSGCSPIMPGTVGTLFGWAVYALVDSKIPAWSWFAIIPGAFILGIVACERTGRDLGVADHGAMVWDEIVAIWLVLAMTPHRGIVPLAAVILFRAFDMTKPPPIRRIERRFKNGFGVMIDDILAAFYALLSLAVLMRLGLFGGNP